MKTDALQHPKTKRLKKTLGLAQFEVIGILEGLFQFACLFANDGRVGKWPAEDLTDFLEWSRDPAELMDAFRAAGWIDGQGAAAAIHDWVDHCPRYITQRLDRRKEGTDEDQQAPTGAAGEQQQQPTKTNPNKPNQKKTATASEVDQLIDRLKTTKGLDPIRKSKGRVSLVRQAIKLIGLADINAALDLFPLDRDKLPNKPEGFRPHVDWLLRDYNTKKATSERIDLILEGKYSNKKRRTSATGSEPPLADQIEALQIAVDAQKDENNRLWLSKVLNSKRDRQAAPA